MTQDSAVQSIVDAIPLPSVFVGSDLRIEGANARAVALNAQAAENRPFVLVFRQPALSASIEVCLNSKTPQKTVYRHDEGSNAVRYDVTLTHIQNPAFQGVLLCFTDVTHLRTADQMRRDFVANVSHELRSPLTAILGFIETLQGPARDDSAARDRFLSTMAAEAERMNRLVGDLLSLSRVEEEARRRPASQEDMDKLIRSVIGNLQTLADENGGTIAYEPAKSPIMLRADPDQMRQVFSNLIENALKYGENGTDVHISVRNIPRDSSLKGPAVAFDISDNGPGIDPIHIPRLTERFYRIDSHRSREKGGTGLGLAIVKHILNRHRGRLVIKSTQGQGSIFSAVLLRD
ncbi:two-component system, OmpR family, phosphate regulon sensor histidine kinase PhoR [Shimia gijangensis]|uniref:histidine kinase n=1 Tax=Shimia gijangensis TaxID=1470563 RepID=A0A1M6PVA0_9RHOB|nr:ATP-binding protein [Shimia gijangensis]SHK11913.1 two-component system, OmpR family, phosphate regulon sensor histidine kinase PhoR [Shimia gijangensis]